MIGTFAANKMKILMKREKLNTVKGYNGYVMASSLNNENGSYKKFSLISVMWLISVFILVGMSLAKLYFIISKYSEAKKVIVCYYNTPNFSSPHQLLPADVNPYLCTHINVAFAEVRNKTIYLTDPLKETLSQMIKLKRNNPNLKILLSVGGAGQTDGFPEMVQDHASRKLFIRSLKDILKNFTLDGVDLDWEFPGLVNQYRTYNNVKGGRERQHFSQLLREIKAEYQREKRDYLLTVAVAAPELIVNMAYDVDQLDLYVDLVNIMTYDFHFYSNYTPFTGLNSPIYASQFEHMYLATLNINYTVNMYISKGLSRDKIVVGIPTYGHSFTLVNKDNSKIGSPASGFGTLGGLGFVLYPAICVFLENYASEITLVQDEITKVPYFFRSYEWVSFDNPRSVEEKAKFIKDENLRGAMIYSLSADDFEGVCKKQTGSWTKFPLSEAVRNALN